MGVCKVPWTYTRLPGRQKYSTYNHRSRCQRLWSLRWMAEIEVCSYCVTERLILMHHLSTMVIGFLAGVQALDPLSLSPPLSLSLSLSSRLPSSRERENTIGIASKSLDLLVCVYMYMFVQPKSVVCILVRGHVQYGVG